MSRQYGGNLSGPISKKKASFFFDFEKRDINDDAIINATRAADWQPQFFPVRSFQFQRRRLWRFWRRSGRGHSAL